MSEPVRVLLVEDQYFFRLALRTTIESRQDMIIVGETGKGAEALPLCREHRPDVVIMDLRLPDISGFEAIAAVHAELPAIGVLVLSNYEGSEDVHRALAAGRSALMVPGCAARAGPVRKLFVKAGIPPAIQAYVPRVRGCGIPSQYRC